MPKGDSPQQLMAEANKILGSDAVIMGSDPSLVVQYISTGVLPIDVLLKGGLPRGRWTEIYGDFSTLKSYVAYRALAEVQRTGGVGVWLTPNTLTIQVGSRVWEVTLEPLSSNDPLPVKTPWQLLSSWFENMPI